MTTGMFYKNIPVVLLYVDKNTPDVQTGEYCAVVKIMGTI